MRAVILGLGGTLAASVGAYVWKSATAPPPAPPVSTAVSALPGWRPEVERAKDEARATLDGFLALASDPGSGVDGFSVLIELRTPHGASEHVWAADLRTEDGAWSGALLGEARRARRAKGERVALRRSDVVDWTYRRDGTVKGHHVGCALVAGDAGRRAELRRSGLDCDAPRT